MIPDSRSFRTTIARALRQALPWVLALAAATCTDDQNGPTHGGRGYFGFRPVYGINGSLSQFGIVADSVHVKLTRPVNQVVLDTTVFFPADSSKLRLALPVTLQTSPESLSAVIGISSGATLLFLDSLDVSVVDGPPSVANIPTAVLAYVGPGKNVGTITLSPGDTTLFLGDTLFFTATALDSAAAPVASFFVGWKTSDTTVAKINGAGRLIAPNLRGSVKVIGTTPTGIADTTTVTFAPVPVIITADSGTAQTGLAGDSLAAQFVARVKGADSLGIQGIAVRFQAVTAGGAVKDTFTLTTDVNGRVRTRGILGTIAGPYSYTATVVSKPSLVRTFAATATAAAPAAIALQSGDLQVDSAGRALPAPFVARVTDAFGNVVTGAKVYWTRNAGNGTVSADSTLTAATGLTSITYTLGAVGSDTVTAALAGTSALVKFHATTISGAPATATKVFGDTQTSVVGQLLAESLAVVVKSATNFPVVGGRVVWTVLRGSATGPDTTFTDVNGRTAIPYTLGTVSGVDSVRAQAGAVTATFTSTAQAAAPSVIAILSGNAQVDTANRALPQPLVVAVTDTFGNPVLGTPVTFTRISGHGHVASDTVTSVADNHPGTAYTFGSIPGTDSVRAKLLANGATVTFAVTSVNATPASVVQTHGSGISATVGTPFTDSLIVRVLDVNSAPIALEKVIWTVTSGSGAVTLDTVLTDSLGFAVQHVTAGSTAGALVVNAKVITPITPVNFALTTNPGAATAIALVSGDAQTDTTGKVLALPLQVHVTDAFGNAIAGAKVAWVTALGTGHPNTDTTLTDVAGNTQVAYTLGATPSVDSVTATLAGTSAFVHFKETAISAAPASILAVSGGGQSAAVTAAFTDSLMVQVLDLASVPVANSTVIWTIGGGGLTLTADTTQTDAQGHTHVRVTAGTVAGTFQIQAHATGVATPASFSLTVNPGTPLNITYVSGDAQTDTTGRTLASPLVVRMTDAYGNVTPGAPVVFTLQSGGGILSGDTVLTDALGHAQVTLTLPLVPGLTQVHAQLAGGAGAVVFGETAISGAPALLAKVFGDAQTDTVLATLTDSLIVQLKDGVGTPIPNAWIYWQSAGVTLSADSLKTDANGRAAVRAVFGAVAGTFPVAVRNFDTTRVAVFTLTAHPGVATQITKVQGTGQTGPVNTPLPIDFGVLVRDAHGNPAALGTKVIWANLAGFTPAGLPDTTATDSTGIAKLLSPLPGPVAGQDSLIVNILGGTAADTFTVTATSGAAAHLVYVSGTGQTDTVSAHLAAPFKVQVRDASSNPVAGTWVHFKRISGTGTVLSDSAQSDIAGAAQTLYDLGPVVGRDSVIATIASSTDTIPFYTVSTPGAPKTLTKISGDSQSVGVNTALPAPFVVKITDQFGNPIQGPTVAFDTVGTGATIVGTPAVTDAAGLATTGTVTLGATAGTITFRATSSSIPGDTVSFIAIALPIGTSKQWTGTLSSAWGTAGNWSPSGVPTAADNVFIPASASNQPVLDAARSVGAFQVEAGANVALGAFNLTTGGATQVDGAMSHTTGVLILNGSATTARGNLTATRVTGTITLANTTTVADSLAMAAGSFTVGGQKLTINGALDITGAGAFTMQNPADSVTVTGLTTWNGTTAAGLLTAGTIVFQGDFTEPTGSSVFQASAGHTSVFSAPVPQTVTFANASVGGNRFGHVKFANANGVTLGGNVAAAGLAEVTAGTVNGTGRLALLGGDLNDPTSAGWNVTTTSFSGTPALLPDSMLHDVDIAGTFTLHKNLAVKGNLTAPSTGALTLGGFTMRVDGTASIAGTAQVIEQNPADSLDIAGAVSWNGSTVGGLLTAGKLVLRGNFTEPSGSAVFQGGGTHTTIFAGAAPQTISFGSASLAGNRFQNVVLANPAGVTLLSNLAAAGSGTITAGTLTGAGRTAFIGDGVIDASGIAWAPDNTELDGTPTVLPDSFAKGVTFNAAVTMGHALVVKGPVSVINSGSFNPGAHTVRFDSTLTVTGSGQVVMNAPTDTLDVAGTTSWNGSTAAGLLTDGTLILRGNFTEPSGSAVFQATANHRTVLAGATAQTVFFGAASLGGNRFNHLTVANAAGITLSSNLAVAGNAAVTAGTIAGVGRTVFLNGSLTDPTNVSWNPDVTEIDGTPGALPDSLAKGLTINGTVILGHGLVVKGPFNGINSGVLTLNGFKARFDSSFTVAGSSQIKLLNAADTLDIAGSASWNGSTAAGLMTAGTTIFRGNFTEPSGATVYQPTGTHRSVFAGTTAQTINFGATGATGNRFNDFTVNNAAGVTLTSNVAVNGNAALVSGTVTGVGRTVFLAGDLSDPTNVSWNPDVTELDGTPAVYPDSFAKGLTISGTVVLGHNLVVKGPFNAINNGVFALNGFKARMDSSFTLSGGHQVKLQNPADTLDIAGTASWDGSTNAGLLTAGTTIFRGNFSEPTGSRVYSATGTHKTVFAGTAAQTVNFGGPAFGTNELHDVDFANAAGVTLTSGIAINGTAKMVAGTVVGVGRTATVGGSVADSIAGWKPDFTVLTGNFPVLPDSFLRNLEFRDSVLLAKTLIVKGNLLASQGRLTLGGHRLQVDSTVTVNGSAQFVMQNSADTMDVAGLFSINGSTTAGLLTAGHLILRGDFSEPSGSSVFQPSGSHATVFAGAKTHTVTFGAPSAGGNRFNVLRIEGPDTLALGNNLVVIDTLAAPNGVPVSIGSTAGVRSVTTRVFSVNTLTFDSVRVQYSGGPIGFFQNVTFKRQDPTAVQFAIAEPGSATPEQLQNVQFLTTPTTGKYISATDTLANGSPLTVQMFHSFPLDGTPFEQQVAGADGATIDWSQFKFLIQPANAGVLAVLDTVQVEVKAPDGNPDANFTGSVSLAIGANPGSATLGGTTTASAVLGIAKFGDLTLSAAGFGYTLVATTAGIAPDTSAAFNITVPLPAGFTSQWLGVTSSDWNTATNWSTGTVPDSTTNVFISGFGTNAPNIQSGTAHVNRLRVAPTALLTITNADSLVADSTVETANGTLGSVGINGIGAVVTLRKHGTVTGTINAQGYVPGDYAVLGTADFGASVSIDSVLTVGPDTLKVGGNLVDQGNGRLVMNDPAGLVDVFHTVAFNGASTAGLLTDGILRLGGDVLAFSGSPAAFAPSGNHLTVFDGTAPQYIQFNFPDSGATGSHLARVQVSTAGITQAVGHLDVLGHVLVTTGATFEDSLGAGVTAHAGADVDAGGTLAVRNLRLGGGLGVTVGATYAVAHTTYYGTGSFPINPAPYDTLDLRVQGVASGDFVVGGDLLIDGSAGPAGFDLGGHAVTVNGGVSVTGSGTLTMQKPADALSVAGDFFANGASTEGLLTAGTLQIGGNFHQSAAVSSAAFRGSAGHLTRFTGGKGHRTIKFDSPINSATDSTNSKFGDLDLTDGIDSLSNNGVFAQRVTLGGSLEYDTTFGGGLSALDSMIVTAAAGKVHLSQLDLYNGIAVAAGPTYTVGTTAFLGGTTLPALPYQSVLISGPTLTMTGNVTASGSFGIGQTGEVGGTPGDLIVNGHTLHVGGSFATGGFGILTMAAGDSVDVGSDITFNGGNTAGHLTGGTLIGRGNFSASSHSGDSTFVAGKAHRTVLSDPLASTIYVNAATESGMQFGKLILLDGAPRAISTFGSRMIVQDSLVLGSATGGLGTARTGAVLAKGPVFTVSGSAINLSNFEADSTLAVSGSWSVTSSIFGGQGQLVPNLTYDDVAIHGTASLTDSLILAPGNTLVVGGAGIPANLDLAGHQVRAGSFVTTEFGTITMTNALDTLDALVSATFDGGDETGKITDGVFRFHGTFTQANTHSDSSFVATGANETRFTDSAAVVQVHAASMATGRSRFNHVTITGSGAGTGVVFLDPVWIGGNAGVASPTIAQVHGPSAHIGGTLNDVGALPAVWAVDTTTFLTHQGFLPARIGGSVVFTAGVALADSLDVAGFVHVTGGSLTPNGHGLNVHGDLATSGLAVFGMGALDTVRVDSSLTLAGGAIGTNLLGGLLQVGKDISVPVPGAFDAAPAHQTVMSGIHQRTVAMAAGNAFGKLDYSDSTFLMTDVHVRGRLTGSGETPGILGGVDSLLTLDDSVAQGVQFTDVRVQINEAHPLFDVTFQEMDPTRTQLTVVGAGAPTPLKVPVIRFHTLPSTGRFVEAVDTLANGDSLIVQMIGSTPFQGQAFSGGTGEAAVRWTKLAFTTLPAVVDSAAPFTVIVSGVGPDGALQNAAAPLDISLAANPAGDVLGGTLSQGFLFGIATFNDLLLTKPVAGVSFHVAVQHGTSDSTLALDTATSAPITVFNPSPNGAIVWDGSAGNGLWSDTTNWSTGLAPSPTDSVFIPAGQSVTFNTVTTVGGLVMGQGATLDLQGDLTVTGRVAAGNTIISTGGTLQLTGGAMQVSGTLPNTRITGSVSAVGHVAVNGNLTIDGPSAEFNVGGKRVDVSNTLTTSNGGLLTMDGVADTVFAADAAFGGGNETGRLIDGVFVLQGTSFTESGGDPNAFNTGGAFKLVFGSAGGPTNAFLSDPSTSHFNHVAVQNPAGVDLSGSSSDDVHILGDLVVSAGGVVHGPQVHVAGNVTSTGPNDSIGFVTLKLDKGLTVGGGYSVINTNFVGDSQVVPALAYQSLILAGANARLGANVLAGSVFVTDTMFAMAGHTLHTPFLNVQSNGRLVMTNPLDSVIVDTTASILGGDETGHLTAGGLVLDGDLNLGIGNFRATRGLGTRFASGRTHHLSASFSFEGFLPPGVDHSNHLGSVDVIGDSVIVTDPARIGVTLTGDLKLTGATWTDSLPVVSGVGARVQGAVEADVGSVVSFTNFRVDSTLAITTPANYSVPVTLFGGTGQTIPALPYQRIIVEGDATLGAPVTTTFTWVQHQGRLDLGGRTFTVDTSLFVNDSAHLVMHTPADILNVLGTATFQGIDATGDMTDGIVRARHLIQTPGTSGSPNAFVQSGHAQVAPQLGDTIEMAPTGPTGSRIGYLDLWGTGGNVYLGNVWVADSMGNGNPATVVDSLTGADSLVVMGDVRWLAGTLRFGTLAVGGTLTVDSLNSSYQVAVTKFIGTAQTIPVNVPYAAIEVDNTAVLGGDLRRATSSTLAVLNTGDLDLNGHYLTMRTFRTGGQGVLTMTHAADTLEANTVTMGGGSTAGHLTAGVIGTYEFDQTNGTSDSSYAPSGTHAFWLENFGSPTEVGAKIQFATPGASYFNILHLYAAGVSSFDKPKLWSNVIVHDSLAVFAQLDAVGQVIDAQGPAAVVEPGAEFHLGTLTVHGTLVVDPTATYDVGFSDFAAGAAPMPAVAGYHGIIVEGAQTLTTPITYSANLQVRGSGVLTPAGHKITGGSGLYLEESGHLVMAAGDTIEVPTASFDGAPSGTDLAGGILRLQSGLSSGNTTNSQTFAPTGMVTEFYGGGTATIALAVVSPSNSFIDTLRVVGGTTIAPTGSLLVLGPTTLKDGSTFDGTGSTSALEFRGKTAVLDTSRVVGGSSSTIFWEDSLSMATPGNYLVPNTEFTNTNGIPDLPYQYLTLADGVHDTLTHPLSVNNQLILSASAPGLQDLVLAGHTVQTLAFSVGGYSRFTMNSPLDTLRVNGLALFGGDDLSGRLTAGRIWFGGDVTQNSSISDKSLRGDGTQFFFDGGGDATQNVSFANSSTTTSYLGNVYVADGGFLNLNTTTTVEGGLTLEFGTTLNLNTPSTFLDIFGGTTLGDGATFNAPNASSIVNFYGLVTRTGFAPTYNVVNTGFTNAPSIPDLTYTNLSLGDGVHDTLSAGLTIAGDLTLGASAPGAQTFVLNGQTVNVTGSLITNGYGQLTMNDPADVLNVGQNASFGGGDLAGQLTAGILSISKDFTQTAGNSDKSFRSTGTKVRFPYLGSSHAVTFATPDSSWFGDVEAGSGGILALNLASDMKAGYVADASTTIIGPASHITADSIKSLLGTFNVVAARVTTKALGANGPGFLTVPTTEYVGAGPVASFNYDTLILAGRDTINTGAIAANHVSITDSTYVGPSGNLHSLGDLVVSGTGGALTNDGGTVTVDDTLLTMGNGTLISQNAASLISVKNARFVGGAETGLLQLGQLAISGDFFQGGTDPESFVADSGFTTQFGGTGNHLVYFSTPSLAGPGGSFFGSLSFTTDAGIVLDLMSSVGVHGKLTTTSYSTPTIHNATIPLQTLSAQDASIQGITFDHVQFHLAKSTGVAIGAGNMDIVTFQNFLNTEDQFVVDLPGEAGQYSWSNFSFTQLDLGGTDTGHYIVANDVDGASPYVLTISLGTNQASDPANYFQGLNGAVIIPFAP